MTTTDHPFADPGRWPDHRPKGWRRHLVVILIVASVIGLVPQSHARAFLIPPPVVAPPVAGLCVTPVAVIFCMAGAVVVSGGLIWAADRIAGPTPQEDGTWDWCEYDGVLAAIECLDGGNPGSASGPWQDLVPEYTPPGETSGSYLDVSWVEPNFYVPRYGSQREAWQLRGYNVTGAVLEPVTDGMRLELFVEDLAGLGDNGMSPCGVGAGVFTGSSSSWYISGWSSCVGIVGTVQTSGMPASVLNPAGQCAGGANAVLTATYSGRSLVETVTCSGEGGLSGSYGNLLRNANAPDSAQNRHFEITTCRKVNPGTWQHSGFGGSANNCNGTGNPGNQQGNRIGMWLTKVEPEMVQAVSTTTCRDADGVETVRIDNGAPAPAIGGEAPPPPIGCLPGEMPVSYTVDICAVGDLESCQRIGSGAIPSIPPEVDMDCLYRLASADPCAMWVEVWTGDAWEVCEPSLENCVDWWENPQRDTHYRCGWGGDYLVASQCVPLRDFYNTTTGGDPITVNPAYPNPDPTAGGDPVQIGGPLPPPSAQPTRTWWGRVIREWSSGTIASMNDSCWPQGWGLLNPLQWVLRPIMCALTWAFVPTEGIVALKLEELVTTYQASSVGVVTQLITWPYDFVTGVTGGGGSCGLTMTLDFNGHVSPGVEVVIIPCAEPYFVEASAVIKPMFSAGIIAGSVIALIRLTVGGVLEAAPAMKSGAGSRDN